VELTSLITWDSVAWLSSSSTTIGSAEAILQFGLSIADLLVLERVRTGGERIAAGDMEVGYEVNTSAGEGGISCTNASGRNVGPCGDRR